MRRHDRAILRHGAVFNEACTAFPPAMEDCIRQWIDAGRSFVVARQPMDRPGVLLGLTLPTAQGRQRVGLVVERGDIASIQAPLTISECLHRLAEDDAREMAHLERSMAKVGTLTGVYGSLAWEVIAEAEYRHADSDIDLICDVSSLSQLCVTLAALRRCAERLAGRLDGEIRFPNGDAVAWKELARQVDDPQASVLVKGEAAIGLLTVQELLGSLLEERRRA